MKFKLSRLEARLQSLIEGSASRLFPSRQQQNDLAYHLLQAMRAGIRPGRDGISQAPNLYTINADPEGAKVLLNNQALLDQLAETLVEAGREAELEFPSPPVIRVYADPALAPGQFNVTARNSRENLSQTSDLSLSDIAAEAQEPRIPEGAFLIVDGTRVVTLTQPVLNIGRRADNQIVIDDPRVSRVHAQLRAIKGRYWIFDLDSTRGTFVNGERVHQSVLHPGDVIALSDVPLVYGQDGDEPDETQDYDPHE